MIIIIGEYGILAYRNIFKIVKVLTFAKFGKSP